MRKIALKLICISTILFVVLGSADSNGQELEKLRKENEALKAIVSFPPSSMDKLYPPIAEQPIFLFNMWEMATQFSAILVNMNEGDVRNAKDNYERFKAKFMEVSKLVPEWEDKFNLNVVEDLGAALETEDLGKVMKSFKMVGNVCHDCHNVFKVKVQQKYHWGDFSEIKIDDPITKKSVSFISFMHFLAGNFTGIKIDVEEDQTVNAQKQFQNFKTRFHTLKLACFKCHTSKRTYFVDEKVQATIDELGENVNGPSIDKKLVKKLIQEIGKESCFKCHLVHVPAASSKYQRDKWEKFIDK